MTNKNFEKCDESLTRYRIRIEWSFENENGKSTGITRYSVYALTMGCAIDHAISLFQEEHHPDTVMEVVSVVFLQ